MKSLGLFFALFAPLRETQGGNPLDRPRLAIDNKNYDRRNFDLSLLQCFSRSAGHSQGRAEHRLSALRRFLRMAGDGLARESTFGDA